MFAHLTHDLPKTKPYGLFDVSSSCHAILPDLTLALLTADGCQRETRLPSERRRAAAQAGPSMIPRRCL